MGDFMPAVLVVEDDKDFAENLQDILRDAGYDVSLCGTIACAREFLLSGCPDVILLDLNLPDGDGAGFLSEIRRLLPQSEVVVITGHASLHSATAAINTQAFGYLVKPVDLDQLQMVIRRAVEGKRAQVAIRDREARLTSIFRAAPVGIGRSDNRAIRDANDFLCSMTGYSRDDLLGKRARMLYDSKEEYARVVRDTNAQIETNGTGTVNTKWRRADGVMIDVMLSSAPVLVSGEAPAVTFTAVDMTDYYATTEALRESEANHRRIVETAIEGIWAVNADGTTGYVNDEMARMLGYTANDMIGRPVADFLTHEAQLDQLARMDNRRAGQSGRYERMYRHADGSDVHCMISAAPIIGDDGEFHGAFAMITDITDRRQAEEALRESHERLQTLSRQLVSIQEAERRNIGRELHDQIGGALTALSIAIKMSQLLPQSNTANANLAEELVGDLTTRIREISLDLRPPMLDDLGLVPALLWYFQRYSMQTNVQVDFRHTGAERRYSPEVETAAFRIAQEALTNAARHADVGEITVRLFADDRELHLQVEDEGIGFDIAAVMAECDTSGLTGMHERASLLGGKLMVESSPGEGTSLTATLPLM